MGQKPDSQRFLLLKVQKMENDSKWIDTQQHLINRSRTEVERLRAEVERNHWDLEGAWEHLRVEQHCLEEIRLNVKQSQSVDNERGQKLSDLLNLLSSTSAPVDIAQESLDYAFEFTNKQQDALNLHWQKLDIQRHAANQQQREGEELLQFILAIAKMNCNRHRIL
ncbi:hypothetical protein [Dolichospermum compactum]|uniref:Uncharacterized protein n=1 Tax=Dolichospermum compactum NIES-806 TaxID=1973481 RepID=A0A1Z4UYN1_9CYAN|nr:hypothetical protein [Dolichospermum compactum]BAZ84195.1 hypothetical protein NIES806_03790 [Dolichospermum compactum NIES-806]